MELNFKNPTIKKEYEFEKMTKGLSVKETSNLWNMLNISEDRIAFLMTIGYLASFDEIADEYAEQQNNGISIDLTYDTVKNIPKILGYQYFAYTISGTCTKDKALEVIKKTLAAYLMLLCMNEHMCSYAVERLNDFENIIRKVDTDPDLAHSWSGLTIKVGPRMQYDMLPEVENAVKVTATGSFRMRFSHVVEIYKRMCGVDLREKGLDDDDFECVY